MYLPALNIGNGPLRVKCKECPRRFENYEQLENHFNGTHTRLYLRIKRWAKMELDSYNEFVDRRAAEDL